MEIFHTNPKFKLKILNFPTKSLLPSLKCTSSKWFIPQRFKKIHPNAQKLCRCTHLCQNYTTKVVLTLFLIILRQKKCQISYVKKSVEKESMEKKLI